MPSWPRRPPPGSITCCCRHGSTWCRWTPRPATRSWSASCRTRRWPSWWRPSRGSARSARCRCRTRSWPRGSCPAWPPPGLAGVEVPSSVAGRYLGDDSLPAVLGRGGGHRRAGLHPPDHPRLRHRGAGQLLPVELGRQPAGDRGDRRAHRDGRGAGAVSHACACCSRTAAARCRCSAAGCAGPTRSGRRRPRGPNTARTGRCAGSTTTASPTTLRCWPTWSATPGPGRSCSARTSRSTWAATTASPRCARLGLGSAEELILGGNAGRLLAMADA